MGHLTFHIVHPTLGLLKGKSNVFFIKKKLENQIRENHILYDPIEALKIHFMLIKFNDIYF